MKRTYEKPELEVLTFTLVDRITNSDINIGGEPSGGLGLEDWDE